MNQKSDLVMDNANKGLYSHRSIKQQSAIWPNLMVCSLISSKTLGVAQVCKKKGCLENNISKDQAFWDGLSLQRML